MKTMKKLLALLMALTLLASLAACGSKDDTKTDSTANTADTTNDAADNTDNTADDSDDTAATPDEAVDQITDSLADGDYKIGVVLMIGGNIPGKTQVVSTEIYTFVEAMEYEKAHILAGGMLVFSFVVLLALSFLNRRAKAVSF